MSIDKLNSRMNKLMKVFGFFAPAPIISALSVTLYVWLLLLCTAVVLIDSINNKFDYSKKFDKAYLFYFVSVIISAIICCLNMPSEWASDVVTLTIQFICVFVLYLYFDTDNNNGALLFFLKGIYLSAIVQMIWGYLQIVFYTIGVDINQLFFCQLLNMYNGGATHTTLDGAVKVSGFCWNAGNFAPLMIIGFLFSNNIYLRLAFIGISFLSGSRTLIIGMFFCILLQLINHTVKNGKVTIKSIKVVSGVVLLGGVVIVLFNQLIVDKFLRVINSINVIANYHTEGSTNTHIMYLISVFDILSKNSIVNNLFGYGPNCSGYPFVKHYDFYSNIGKWCVECDYINCLWNYGLIGFFFYYLWYLKNYYRCKKLDSNYKVLFLTFLGMGLMYNITFNWMSLVLISLFILAKRNVTIFETSYEKSTVD